eukprot:1176726-Prorocentrum_minimum.AAC.2
MILAAAEAQQAGAEAQTAASESGKHRQALKQTCSGDTVCDVTRQELERTKELLLLAKEELSRSKKAQVTFRIAMSCGRCDTSVTVSVTRVRLVRGAAGGAAEPGGYGGVAAGAGDTVGGGGAEGGGGGAFRR